MIARIGSLTLALFMAAASANPFAEKKSPATASMAYMNRLMRGAYPTENSQLRRLEEEEYDIDISGYSLKFQKCQFVKSYDDDMAENEESGTVLATKRFVVFRLCPSNSCSSCNYGYGEYLVDMEEYLDATIEYAQEQQQEICEQCEEDCEYYGDDQDQNDEADNEENGNERRLSSNCGECTDTCEKIENMEENGYIDATDFVQCQNIQNAGDDDGVELYAGAMCASSGYKIKIGVFSDENCMNLESNLDVENYLADGDGNQMKLSHALLKTTYESDSCFSCLVKEEDDENNNDGDEKEPEVEEVCQELYESAAKCEKTHGFDNGYSNYNDVYENQLENEEVVCDFISSLKSGTYSQDGEIVVGGSNSYHSGATSTTGGQKFALTFFILGTVGLAVYAAMLHTNLTKSAKSDLSSQGGAMA